MNTEKIKIFLLLCVVSIGIVACSNGKSDNNSISKGENITEDLYHEKLSDKNVLAYTYKVPGKSIYVDVPDFKELSRGYVKVFTILGKEHINVVCECDEEINDLDKAQKKVYEILESSIQDIILINELTVEEEEYTTINGMEVYRYKGKIKCGDAMFTDCYAVGYAFIVNGRACGLIGIAEIQEQEVIDDVTNIIDEMIKTVRTEE